MKSELDNKIDFKEILRIEAIKNNIELNDKMLERLELYKNLLVEWNEKINLTAITDNYEIILKHFVDSLECIKYIKETQTVIDVGTGAGFPGIVIAIYFEDKIKVTLLDALNKRISFLQEVVEKLNLKNVYFVHGRAEEMAQNVKFREKFDIAVSRAVASLPVLLEFEIPYVKVNGKCLLMKGDSVQQEIDVSSNALKVLNSKITNLYKYSYKVHDEIYNRSIVEIIKLQPTNIKYPRSYGKIKKQNL